MNKLARQIFPKLFGNDLGLDINECQWMTNGVKHSPDLGYLEQFEFQLLFSYDDTKSGHLRHGLIEDSTFVTTAYTRRSFSFWEQRVQLKDDVERTPIPIIMPDGVKKMDFGEVSKFPPPLKIQGEVHAIRPWQFKGLDEYKQNRVQFTRKRVDLIVPYREFTALTNVSDDGQPLPYTLHGRKTMLSEERVHILRAWMYVANPDYWNPLLDAGWNGLKTVHRAKSRRAWLEEYYAYPKRILEGDK